MACIGEAFKTVEAAIMQHLAPVSTTRLGNAATTNNVKLTQANMQRQKDVDALGISVVALSAHEPLFAHHIPR